MTNSSRKVNVLLTKIYKVRTDDSDEKNACVTRETIISFSATM